VVPGEAFGTAAHIRISFAASLEDLERGLNRLHEFLARLRT
jgi:aspartate aminotransferase